MHLACLPLLRVLLAPVTIYDSGYVQKVGLYSFDMARPQLSRQQTLPWPILPSCFECASGE